MIRGKHALDGLDQDIREHIEHETQDNIDRGMTPEEARRHAVLKFGNVALAARGHARRLGVADGSISCGRTSAMRSGRCAGIPGLRQSRC